MIAELMLLIFYASVAICAAWLIIRILLGIGWVWLWFVEQDDEAKRQIARKQEEFDQRRSGRE